MKQSRYYEIVNSFAYVYDHPYSSKALSVSVVPIADLAYYRKTFALSKVWGIAP